MTAVVVTGILAGAVVSVAGLVLAWRGAGADEARAGEDVKTAARLAEQERVEVAALPEGRTAEDVEAVHEASTARYDAAGLDRPTYGNLSSLPLLAKVRETRRAGHGVRVGVFVSALGVAVSTATAFIGL